MNSIPFIGSHATQYHQRPIFVDSQFHFHSNWMQRNDSEFQHIAFVPSICNSFGSYDLVSPYFYQQNFFNLIPILFMLLFGSINVASSSEVKFCQLLLGTTRKLSVIYLIIPICPRFHNIWNHFELNFNQFWLKLMPKYIQVL